MFRSPHHGVRHGRQMERPSVRREANPGWSESKPSAKRLNAFGNVGQVQLIWFSKNLQHWLVWLSGLSAGLRTKGSQAHFPGSGPGPQKGAHKRQPHIDVSLPLFLSPFPSL